MCIRDSTFPACHARSVVGPTIVNTRGGRGAQWGCRPLRKDCLLYTSDAADERSSVDLGGRRIIKKKKTVQHYGGGRVLKRDKNNRWYECHDR